jgi:hypothetical protein
MEGGPALESISTKETHMRIARTSLIVVLSLACSLNSYASDFYAIAVPFEGEPRLAFMDVVVEPAFVGGAVDVLFTVFPQNGAPPAEFTVPIDANGLASSRSASGPARNFFRLTDGAPALVRARVPNGAAAAATLDVRSSDGRVHLGVPYAIKNGGSLAAGRFFPIAIGNVRAATLLIANVSGTDVGVDVWAGATYGAHNTARYSTPRLVTGGIWRVDLTAAEFNSFVVVGATDQIICQVVTDTGRVFSYIPLPV